MPIPAILSEAYADRDRQLQSADSTKNKRKLCNCCQVWKHVGCYSKGTGTRDGLQGQCKTCLRKKAKAANDRQRKKLRGN